MIKKRKSLSLAPVTMSKEEADAVMAVYAKAEHQIVKLTAQLDLEMTRIREKYQDKLALLEKERKEAEEKLFVFANANRETYFSTSKTLELTHGAIGFRTGTPSLKTKKGYTWASVLELAKTFATHFVRTKEELDKEGLIQKRFDNQIQELYDRIGVQVVQEEKWFVVVKTEESDL